MFRWLKTLMFYRVIKTYLPINMDLNKSSCALKKRSTISEINNEQEELFIILAMKTFFSLGIVFKNQVKRNGMKGKEPRNRFKR